MDSDIAIAFEDVKRRLDAIEMKLDSHLDAMYQTRATVSLHKYLIGLILASIIGQAILLIWSK